MDFKFFNYYRYLKVSRIANEYIEQVYAIQIQPVFLSYALSMERCELHCSRKRLQRSHDSYVTVTPQQYHSLELLNVGEIILSLLFVYHSSYTLSPTSALCLITYLAVETRCKPAALNQMHRTLCTHRHIEYCVTRIAFDPSRTRASRCGDFVSWIYDSTGHANFSLFMYT